MLGKVQRGEKLQRCMALLLCCALVFGMAARTQTPARAEAASATVALLGGGGATVLANPVGAAVGILALVGVGLEVGAGYVHHDDSIFYGTAGYELGAKLWDELVTLGSNAAAWGESLYQRFFAAGGITAGDTFEIPPDVAASLRQWATDNLDFTDGVISNQQYALLGDAGNSFVLTQAVFPADLSQNYVEMNITSLGNVLVPPTYSATGLSEQVKEYTIGDLKFKYSFTDKSTSSLYWLEGNLYCNFSDGVLSENPTYSIQGGNAKNAALDRVQAWLNSGAWHFTLCYEPGSDRVYALRFSDGSGFSRLLFKNKAFVDAGSMVADVPTTFDRGRLDEDIGEDVIPVRVPDTLVNTRVGDLTIPVIGELTQADVLATPGVGEDEDNPPVVVPGTGTGVTAGEITQAITDALPITGSIAGDQVVEETLTADPQDLGGVFITRFPFCIPWDLAKAIKLLAVPPTTPRWEFDFLGPVGDLVGGFDGDTTIVVDFSDYELVGILSRWLSTVGFVYFLASKTKEYLWTS